MQYLTLIRFWQLVLIAISATWLSACGGGGSEGTVSASPPAITSAGAAGGTSVPLGSTSPSAPAPTPTPTPTTAVPTPVSNLSAASTCAIPDFQNLILQRVNALRTAGATCSAQGI